jgi:hypothetical protein
VNAFRDLNNRVAAAVGTPIPFANTAAQSAGASGLGTEPGLVLPDVPFWEPPPPPAEVGPNGRTYDEITGTDYLSEAERAWYLERTPGADPAALVEAQRAAAASATPAADPMSAMEQVEVAAQEPFAAIPPEPDLPPEQLGPVINPAPMSPLGAMAAEGGAGENFINRINQGAVEIAQPSPFAQSALVQGPLLGLTPEQRDVGRVAEVLQQNAENDTRNTETLQRYYEEQGVEPDYYAVAQQLIDQTGSVEAAMEAAGAQLNALQGTTAAGLGMEFLATAGPFAALRGAGLASTLLGRGAGHSIGRFMATELGAEIGAGVAATAADDAGLGLPGQIAAGLFGGAVGSIGTNVGITGAGAVRNIANPTPPAPRGEPLGSILSRANEKGVTANYLRSVAEQRGIDVSDIPASGSGQKRALVDRLTQVHEEQVAQTASARAIVDQAVEEGVLTVDDVESLKTEVRAALTGSDNPDIDEALDEIVESITVRTIAAAEPELSAPPEPKLRRDLAGAEPRYLNAKLKFESDLDKASFITANTAKKSKRDADYLRFVVDNTGLDEAAVRARGRALRTTIGGLTPDENGVIFVPRSDIGSAAPATPPTAPLLEPDEGVPGGPPGGNTAPPPRTPRPPSGPPPPGGGTQGALPMDVPEPARPWSLSIVDNLIGALGLPQTIAASGDLSAIARQGQILGWRNPKDWLEASKASLRAFANEEYADEVMRVIKGSPLYDPQDTTRAMGMKNAGLQIWEFGEQAPSARSVFGVETGSERVPGFTGLNKSAVSRVAEAIPGVGMSERAYATFLNVQGAQVYEKYARALWRAGFRDEETFKDLAKVINHARGYGDLTLEIIPGLNAFFSGRYMSSRFNVLLDPLRRKGSLRKQAIIDPETGRPTGEYATSPRRIAAENLAAFTAANMSLLGLIAASGAATGKWSVEFDPRESDGGKIKIGETRIDPWAGFGPVAKLISRSADDITRNGLGLDAVPAANRQGEWEQELVNFFRNKASPIVTMVIDHLAGETAIGEEPITSDASPERLARQFAPFLFGDVFEAFKNTEGSMLERVLTAAGVGSGSAIGLGTQTYQTVRERQDRMAREQWVIDPTTGKPRERLDGEKGPGPSYSQLLPTAQQKIREELLSRGVVKESTITKSGRAFQTEHVDEQQQATELAFLEGQIDSGKTLPEFWKEINLQKFGASAQRAIDYAKTIEGFSETEFSKLIEEYFAIEATFPNTKQYDPGATEELRQKFLEELKSRPTPEGALHSPYEVVNDYLDLIAGKKSPLEQDYRAFIKDLGNSGYYDLDDKGREAWMLEHPEYEAQQAYWKSGVIGADPPKLKSVEAAEFFDALNATYGSSHVAGIERFKLPYSEENKDAWTTGGPLVEERYFALTGKERTAAGEDPWINAWLFYLGYDVVLKTGGPGGSSEAYRRLIQQYGDNGIPPEFAKEVKVVNTPLR